MVSPYSIVGGRHPLPVSARQNNIVDSSWQSIYPALPLVAAQQTVKKQKEPKKLKEVKDPHVELQQQLDNLKTELMAVDAIFKPTTVAEFNLFKEAQLQVQSKYCALMLKWMKLYSFSDFQAGKKMLD